MNISPTVQIQSMTWMVFSTHVDCVRGLLSPLMAPFQPPTASWVGNLRKTEQLSWADSLRAQSHTYRLLQQPQWGKKSSGSSVHRSTHLSIFFIIALWVLAAGSRNTGLLLSTWFHQKDKCMILAEKSTQMWKLRNIQVIILAISFYTPVGHLQEPEIYQPLM